MKSYTTILAVASCALVIIGIALGVTAQKPTLTPVIVEIPKETPPPPGEHGTGLVFQLLSPLEGAAITSPLELSGKARGTWFFEGSFPIALHDASGTVLAEGVATADGEWMTEGDVDWKSTLTWATTTATSGTLIFKKDNPSGMPEHDAAVEVPIVF